ncbi:alpha-1,2-fucosyltransferase [Segetibacter koreensis]|uniref:alpha-1,2-fucosyltransferase n=1 Tax=Segetibacter koreensis TaxID=398037 RepID=UPI00037AB0F6|nr:alpha-1,2-fucosyltransferase [Segetibacter koreensis]
MVVVKLIGGMGNQMFQYAIGRHLAIKNKCPLYFDHIELENKNTANTPRNYELDIFNVQYQKNPFLQSNRFVAKVYHKLFSVQRIKEPDFTFHPHILNVQGNIHLNGYWQNENYFKEIEEIIRQDFTFKTPANEKIESILQQIAATNSVSLHVRRGDYITLTEANQFHGVCSDTYYQKAIAKIKEAIPAPHLFVFSDDIHWVKQNMPFTEEHTFVDGNTGKNSFEDLRLMAACRHNILANSSFSWWAGWLNKNPEKMVIAPEKWFRAVHTDIVPPSWIKM